MTCNCRPIHFHGKRRKDSAVVNRTIHAADCPITDTFQVLTRCPRCQRSANRHAWWCFPQAA